jgi:hypothetical protein
MAGYGQDNTYERHSSRILRLHPIATLGESKIECIRGAWVDLPADIGDPSRPGQSATFRAELGVSLYLDIMVLVTMVVQIGKFGWSSGNIAAF